MEQLSSSVITVFTVLIIIALVLLTILWWTVFVKDYLIGYKRPRYNREFKPLQSNEGEKSDEVWAASLVLVAFLCLLCETGLCIDPFGRFHVWQDGVVRLFQTTTITLLISYMLIFTDATIWLNYITLGSLLIKPRGSHRYTLYVSCGVFLIQSSLQIIIYGIDTDYSRGFALGWLLTSVLLVFFSVLALVISLWDIKLAVELGDQHGGALDLDKDIFEEEKKLSRKTVERSRQLIMYLCIIGFFVFIDLCRGLSSDRGGTELVYLMYGLGLKLLIVIMLLQRKPIGGSNEKYRPFVTFKSGDTSSKTVYNFITECNNLDKMSSGAHAEERWGLSNKPMHTTKNYETEDSSENHSKVELIGMGGEAANETQESSVVIEPKEVIISKRYHM